MTQAPVRKERVRLVPLKMIVATALAFTISFTAPTTTVYAQAASHESQQTPTPDPSERAPAPSTWKGAFEDSLRLLLLGHLRGSYSRERRVASCTAISLVITDDHCESRTPGTMATIGQ